jgi:hypothetical protein
MNAALTAPAEAATAKSGTTPFIPRTEHSNVDRAEARAARKYKSRRSLLAHVN